VLHGWLSWLLHSTSLRTGNDDALYLLLARALRQLSYRDLHILGAPIHSQYPPGYPALLAVTGGGLGLDLTWPSLTSTVLSMIALLLLFDLGRRVMPLGFALGLLALLALNDSLLTYAGAIRSETPYTTFSIAAIWAFSVWPGSRKAIVLGASMALMAGLTRSIGATLLGAIGLFWLVEGHYRRVVQFGLGCLLTLGAWTAWNFLAPVKFARRSYALTAVAMDPAYADNPLGLVVRRLERFATTYALSLPANLSVPSLEGQWIDNVFWLGLIIGLVGVGCYAARRQAPLVPVYVIAYLAFLAAWPHKLSRFLVPMTPFVLLLLVWGGATVSARWRNKGVFGAILVIAALLVYGESDRVRARLQARSNCDPANAIVSKDCPSVDEQSFSRMLAFVRTRVPEGTAVLTTKEATFAIFTGRTVMHPDMARAQFGADFLPHLDSLGVHFIVLNPLVPSPLPTLLLPRCHELTLVEDFPPRTALLQLGRDSTAAATPDGCAVITRLVQDSSWLGDGL
jgi:hypothetical protein